YIRSGQFVRKLLDNSKQTHNPNLRAYALGYLTHYVADALGHGYVNQIVQAPWRLYWQRHHLVENFIDAYIWDRWHVSRPAPPPPTTEEQPLDAVTNTPNVLGSGAPLTFARLHDHISIGTSTLGDPLDQLVKNVCDKIEAGLFNLGIAEADLLPPDDNDFQAWTLMIVNTLTQVYKDIRHPKNLAPERDCGIPSAEDVAGAYGVMRVLLKFSTEEKIQEPKPPNILKDISDALSQFYNDLKNNLGRFPPPPLPSFDGCFRWDALGDASKSALDWLSDFGEWLGKTVFDSIRDLINIGGTILTEPIKFFLYLLNKWLFSIYRSLRDYLVLAAYAVPFTEELGINMGGPLRTRALWQSMGDLPSGRYPQE